MRASICLFTIGFVAAAICFGAVDEKSKKDSSTAGAKGAAVLAPQPADAGKSAPGKPTTEKTAKPDGDASAARQLSLRFAKRAVELQRLAGRRGRF